jgi:hypothetical protein
MVPPATGSYRKSDYWRRQTDPKTRGLFEGALGKTLFVDEAYRLSGSRFAKDAIDELVGVLSQNRFKAKLVVILAGYDQLLSTNPGLSGRFPVDIVFENVGPSQHYMEPIIPFYELSELPSWGNTRGVVAISKEMILRLIIRFLLQSTRTRAIDHLIRPGCSRLCMRATLKGLRDRGNLPQNPSPLTHPPPT